MPRIVPSLRDKTQGCPVAFADLATHLLRDDRAATCDEAAAAVKRDAALQRQLVEGVVYALEWILDSINVQQTGRGSPAGGAEGRAAGERPYGALPPEQLWHAAAQAINSLTSDLFLRVHTELARTEPESWALAPAGRVLRLLSAAGPELSDDCRAAVTTFTCRLCGVAGRAITPRHEPSPASASWAVLRMLPDATAALRWLEKSEAAKGSASSSPQATGMTPSTLDSASLVCFGFLMQVPTTAPEVNSPAHAAVWCCAAEAALRLLPMAARMKAECAEPDAQENRPALGNLAGSAAVIWGAYLEPVAVMHERVTRTDAGRLAVAETAAEPLWRLHSAAVQLVHFAASEGAAQLRALHPCLSQWPWYAANLSSTFQMAFDVHRMACDDSDSDAAIDLLQKRWQAICAAHAGAVQVLASRMGLQPNRMDIALSMDLRLVVAATPSAALTPDLPAAFDHVTRQYWQAASRARGQVAMPILSWQGIDGLWDLLHRTVVEAEQRPACTRAAAGQADGQGQG